MQTLSKDTPSLFVVDFSKTDKKLVEYSILNAPNRVKAAPDRLSTMQCKLFQKGSIHCVQAGSGALYFELTIEDKYQEAKVNTVIRYSAIHNLLAQKVILNAGRKFFLVVGHT